MGAPEHPDEFQRFEADDLTLYLSQQVLSSLKPEEKRLLVAVGGYGRFRVELVGDRD